MSGIINNVLRMLQAMAGCVLKQVAEQIRQAMLPDGELMIPPLPVRLGQSRTFRTEERLTVRIFRTITKIHLRCGYPPHPRARKSPFFLRLCFE